VPADIENQTNVCISNYVLHHNPEIWGDDHMVFDPERFANSNPDIQNNLQNLIPFSVGHRMCIGKNLAMTNILKTVTTLFSLFEFEPLDHDTSVRLESAGVGEIRGEFLCRVQARKSVEI